MPSSNPRFVNSRPVVIELLTLVLVGIMFLYLTIGQSAPRGDVAGLFTVQTTSSDPLPNSSPSPPPVPVAANPLPEPLLTAKAVYVWDPASNTVLYSRNPHLRLPPASTTKLMTAWVALHAFDPQTLITVNDADRTVGQTANLVAGEQMTVANLIQAMLINSGNDAALALAQAHPEGYSKFVELMNQTAQDLGLLNTHFTNVSGLEDPNHYSSAYDLSRLAWIVTQNALINQAVQTKNQTVSDAANRTFHLLENTNKLLWANNGVNGIKTGWTTEAGECLITRTVRPEYTTFITLLGSQDRFGETQKLIDWVYQNYQPVSN